MGIRNGGNRGGQGGGGTMDSSRGFVLKAMPSGKWKGVPFRGIPTQALRGLLDWWSSDRPENSRMRESIVNALTDEWIRRESRKQKAPEKPGKRRRRRRR